MSSQKSFAVRDLFKIFDHVDPAFIYITIAQGLNLVYQFVTGNGSVWQKVWDPMFDFVQTDKSVWFIIVPTLVTNGFYWGFGLIMLAAEHFNQPKQLNKYKIQPDKSGLDDHKKLFGVRSEVKVKIIAM